MNTVLASLFTGMLVASLQSCGSSSPGSTSPSTELFSDPVDAQTLRSALITGSSSSDFTEYWQCTISGLTTQFEYRLFADGSGIEIGQSNPTVQSAFTWATTSAFAMTTTVDVSGEQNEFTDIRFVGRDSMSLLLAASDTTLSCDRRGGQPTTPPAPPADPGDNSLSYGGVAYPLTHGFEEVFSYRPTQFGDTHLTAEFSVADGPFRQTVINGSLVTTVIWRPRDATVWLQADLHSPGGDGFQSATFYYEPDSTDDQGPLVTGRFFFNEGRFGIDINEDGSIDSDFNEFIDITGGIITINRLSDTIQMNFDITLADGVNVIGSFTGVFPLYENF